MPSTERAAFLSTVIYAKDIRRVAEFYRRTVPLAMIETDPGFMVLGGEGFEVTVVQIPEQLAQDIAIAAPPIPREETPIKLSFLVENLDRVHQEAAAAGGSTKPVAEAWSWRGQLHLDGCDPEGNVVQFRTSS